MTNEAMEKLDQLAHLNSERDKLHHDLRKSLTIQGLWADAFEFGQCTSRVTGNPRGELTFTITLGNNEQRSLPLEEVPVILWSEQVKDDIRQLGPFHCHRYFKLLKNGEINESDKP